MPPADSIQQMGAPRHIDMNSDVDVLFGTIDGEAESEGLLGQQAVGWSIANRAVLGLKHPHFGDGTIRSACLAHAQYSCWLPGKDLTRIQSIDLDNLTPIQGQIMTLAKGIVANSAMKDFTKGATHYFAPYIPAPSWVAGAWFCGVFGTQLFWRGVK